MNAFIFVVSQALRNILVGNYNAATCFYGQTSAAITLLCRV